MLTAEELRDIMPFSGDRADEFEEPLQDAMREFAVSDNPLREAAFIAQIAYESGELRYMQEIASGEAYNGRADLGNTRPEAIAAASAAGTTPGPYFKGRGPLQITGYDNYVACGAALGLDLVSDPSQLAQPIPACRSAGWFWATHGCNEAADKQDFIGITRRINGALTGLADREKYYRRALAVLGEQE